MTKLKLYEKVINYYMLEINAGRLNPGDRIPTELELAEQFNVSRITVIRALRELETKGLLKRIKKKGSFITEAAKPSSSNLLMPLPIIAVLLPFSEDIVLEIIDGVQEACIKKGYYMTFHNTKYDSILEKETLQMLMRDNIHGAIIYPCASDKNIDIFSEMLINKFPFVMIDRSIDGLDIPCIASDNLQAAYSITTYLIELGHKKIGFVCSSIKDPLSATERYRGYCKALIDKGISPKQEWLFEDIVNKERGDMYSPTDNPEMHLEIAQQRLQAIKKIKEPITAVVVINDFSAMYLMKAAQQDGISIPEELSITGFDNMFFTEFLEVPLTTVQQDFKLIGQKAAEFILNSSQNSRDVISKLLLGTELIVRKSTAAPNLVFQ